MFDVLTIGDAAYDIFIKPDSSNIIKKYDKDYFNFSLGSKVAVDEADFKVGGSAANVAAGLCKLGLSSGICGQLGADDFAKDIEKKLAEEGISVDYLKNKSKNKTNFSVILRGQKDRTILVYHGFDHYGDLPLPKKKVSEWFYLSPLGKGYEDLTNKITSLRAEKNIKLAFNPGTLQLENYRNILPLLRITNILFVNVEEAIKVVDWRGAKPTIKNLLKSITEKGIKIAVITKGREGVAVSDGSYFFEAPAFPADRVDVTGAGDSFAAGFLTSVILDEKSEEKLSQEDLLKRSIEWGSVNSSSVIEKVGAQDGLLTVNEIQKKLNSHNPLKIVEI